jgi:anti-sigma regulatory factor (Ser/Thr protein kinase)
MEDLSLHILDLVENSIRAGAMNITIEIIEDSTKDSLLIYIHDDGKGIDKSLINKVIDPFYTTKLKSPKNFGLGLSLIAEAARAANGVLTIDSNKGIGTKIKVTFQRSHIDCKPLGDINKTLTSLIIGNPDIRFQYLHKRDDREIRIDTNDLLVSVTSIPAKLQYLKGNLGGL